MNKNEKNASRAANLQKAVGARIYTTRYSDSRLLEAYLSNRFSFGGAAKELGMSRQQISTRLKNAFDLDREKAGYLAAKSIVAVREAIADVPKQTNALEALDELSRKLRVSLDRLSLEMDENFSETHRQKPLHIGQLVKLINAEQNLLNTYIDFEATRYETEGTRAFISTVIAILKTEIPDVEAKLFEQLSRRGAGCLSVGR